MNEKNVSTEEKKSIFKKWWFWIIAFIAISIVVSSLNDSKEKMQPIIPQSEQKTEPTTTEKTNPTPVIEKTKVPLTPTKKETATTVNTPAPQTDRANMLVILKANASAKWGTNYEMVKYEYDNQVVAYDWVMAQTTYPDIMTKAKQKWGNNYEMVKYEYNNQVEAYKSL
jgi:hypothetical protein